jgi:DNA-binding protein HU-beta
MNKTELIANMAESAGISKAAADRALLGFLEAVTDGLQNGERVTLIGFGTFSVSERSARTGRNPQTGKAIEIPAKTVVKFKPGKKLADAVK